MTRLPSAPTSRTATRATAPSLCRGALAREGDRLLLLAEAGIECVTCYSGWGESWADSALRAWLAQEFPSEAFTEEERARLVPVEDDFDTGLTEVGSDGASLGRYVGASSARTVAANDVSAPLATLLAVDQVERYLPDPSSRFCTAAKAALAERAFAAGEDGAMGWWLRPPEDAGYFAASVRRDGSILTYGGDMGRDVLCVRPAIWVRP